MARQKVQDPWRVIVYRGNRKICEVKQTSSDFFIDVLGKAEEKVYSITTKKGVDEDA